MKIILIQEIAHAQNPQHIDSSHLPGNNSCRVNHASKLELVQPHELNHCFFCYCTKTDLLHFRYTHKYNIKSYIYIYNLMVRGIHKKYIL